MPVDISRRDEAILLAKDLLELKFTEDDDEWVVGTLIEITGDPAITDYLFWSNPPLSAEDAIDLAMKLRDVKWTRMDPP